MAGRNYTETFEMEMSSDELATLGASLGDGRCVGDMLLGHISQMVDRAQSQAPLMLQTRIPHINVVIPQVRQLGVVPNFQALPHNQEKKEGS